MARPKREIPQETRDIIGALIGAGDSDRRVAKITGVDPRTWKRLAESDGGFAALLDTAHQQRAGNLARVLRDSMIAQIKRGHPWWAKLAIHNYPVLLKDPDVNAALRLKRATQSLENAPNDLPVEEHAPAGPPVKAPRGTTPPDDE